MNKLLILAAVCCLSLCPLHAAAGNSFRPASKLGGSKSAGKAKRTAKKTTKREKASREDKRAERDEELAAEEEEKPGKKSGITKEERDNLKFKWYGSLKAALAAARKNNTTCFVVYSDPSRCQACAKFESEVLNSREFKSARGIGVGFKSPTPLPQFGLDKSKPMTVVVDADGRIVSGNMGYHKGLTMDIYLDRLRNAQPTMFDTPAEEESED